MSSPPHAPKKRQYAAGETQVYYGSAEGQYPADTPDIHQPADTATSLTPQHVDLMAYPPDPRDLYAPPLPSGLSVLIDPTETRIALSYQSSTLNAVPRTQSLLSNSKLPLGLVISPHRTLADGEEAVPVVQDGLISRCQRCKAYMNPYVQFLDGNSRSVTTISIAPSHLCYSHKAGAAPYVGYRTTIPRGRWSGAGEMNSPDTLGLNSTTPWWISWPPQSMPEVLHRPQHTYFFWTSAKGPLIQVFPPISCPSPSESPVKACSTPPSAPSLKTSITSPTSSSAPKSR